MLVLYKKERMNAQFCRVGKIKLNTDKVFNKEPFQNDTAYHIEIIYKHNPLEKTFTSI